MDMKGGRVFLQSNDKDGFKLQSFGGVDGHEGDVVVRVLIVIQVGKQGDILEVAGKRFIGYGVGVDDGIFLHERI